MKENNANIRWFLAALSLFILPLQSSVCSAQGFVGASLNEITPTRTAYTYVFSGVITCGNRPCANTRVDVNIITSAQGAIAQSTRTQANGRYQLAVVVYGSPEDASLWKIQARSGKLLDPEYAQAEGSIILLEDQKTVVVDRSLLLTQA